jgi:hypothetical protein
VRQADSWEVGQAGLHGAHAVVCYAQTLAVPPESDGAGIQINAATHDIALHPRLSIRLRLYIPLPVAHCAGAAAGGAHPASLANMVVFMSGNALMQAEHLVLVPWRPRSTNRKVKKLGCLCHGPAGAATAQLHVLSCALASY